VYECCLYLVERRADALRTLGAIRDQQFVCRAGPMRAIADFVSRLYRAVGAWPPTATPRIPICSGLSWMPSTPDGSRRLAISEVERFRS